MLPYVKGLKRFAIQSVCKESGEHFTDHLYLPNIDIAYKIADLLFGISKDVWNVVDMEEAYEFAARIAELDMAEVPF